ncbi:PDR/VanB family oxidoreductase [Paraburkholderia tropica]|uniref:PDR/VanB family oxidoreductase n=1 Tax=Paraburkholderia tropica TaxID=92647 RepID=UPI002AB2ABEF|nr:PDR/VanB family oxidoreductase [Paraburkholderia tropica]
MNKGEAGISGNRETGLLKVRITARCREANGIDSFELACADGSALPPFSAGAHIDVHIRNQMVRQYSLCNAPGERHRYMIAVLRDPCSRGGSAAVHEEFYVGAEIGISSPQNHFPLSDETGPSLLLAGGIGVTPILCMAEHLHAAGKEYVMHYCTRSPENTAFYSRIRNSGFAPRVAFHFDDEDPARRFNLKEVLEGARSDHRLYVCGPRGFMDAVLGEARQQGWHEERLHYEFFSAAPGLLVDDSAFEVELASCGTVVAVHKNETVAQALMAAGVEIPLSCEQGVCGTCVTRVLDGIPDHRDLYLTAAEKAGNDRFTPCCSRARTKRLVLDI